MRASDDPTEQMRQQLDEVIAQGVPTSSRLRIDSLVRRGPPWEKLTNVATELGADMIVVGADGQRGAASQGFVGTVASRLITTSRRPVLVVPTPLRPDR
jgi:nucleotide-binding universal stress UspA family protein